MKIAVIIPAHNEERVIRNTIVSLCWTGMRRNNIYIVDDASVDRTADVVKESEVNLLSLKENIGKAGALRKGIDYFRLCERYEYIIFIDADTEAERGLIDGFGNAARQNDKAALFVGQVKAKQGGYISALRAVEYAIGQDLHRSGQSKHGVIFIAPGCASMYRSDILEKLEFKGDTLAEDMDLTMQVQRQKAGEIVYTPKAVVYTQDPGNLRDYVKQITRWQRGVWQVIKKYRVAAAFSRKQKVDLMIVALVFDALAWNRFFLFPVFLAFLSLKAIGWLILLDIAFMFFTSVYAAAKNKRWDVVYEFPLYFWLTYLNSVVFLKSFVEVMVFKKEVMPWSRVKRY